MYLSASLKEAGHEVHFVDVELDGKWEERIFNLAPQVVGYSVITGSQDFFLSINHRLKKRFDFLSLWGGPHPTFFPEFINEQGVDTICIGEGEHAMLDLARALDRGDDISSISNLHVKTPGGVIANAPRPLCQDLDSIPFPDRSILNVYPQYRYVSARSVITSRGCPHRCTFCYNALYQELYRGTGRYSRRRSVGNVIEECIGHREDPWAKHILFRDDLFAENETYLKEFARLYSKEVGLPFACNVRADRMTPGTAEELARAGARVVHFGVESANDRIRKDLLGRRMSLEQMRNAAHWLKEKGIKVYTYNIVGIPEETPREAMETLRFNAQLRADMAIFTLFQPYPRTPLGKRAVELGWIDEGFDNFSPTYYKNSMSRLPHQRLFKNMVHLFPAASVWPVLRWFTPLLVRLPLTPLYAALDFLYKAIKFVFSLRLVTLGDIVIHSRYWHRTRKGDFMLLDDDMNQKNQSNIKNRKEIECDEISEPVVSGNKTSRGIMR